jgi:hypothetical protein
VDTQSILRPLLQGLAVEANPDTQRARILMAQAVLFADPETAAQLVRSEQPEPEFADGWRGIPDPFPHASRFLRVLLSPDQALPGGNRFCAWIICRHRKSGKK